MMIIISSSCRSSSKHMQIFEVKRHKADSKFSRDYGGDKWFDRWVPDGYLDSSRRMRVIYRAIPIIAKCRRH